MDSDPVMTADRIDLFSVGSMPPTSSTSSVFKFVKQLALAEAVRDADAEQTQLREQLKDGRQQLAAKEVKWRLFSHFDFLALNPETRFGYTGYSMDQ